MEHIDSGLWRKEEAALYIFLAPLGLMFLFKTGQILTSVIAVAAAFWVLGSG